MLVTLMDLLTEAVMKQMPLDRRLSCLDVQIRILMHAAPPCTVGEMSCLTGANHETVRRSMNRLLKAGWVLKAGEKRGRESLFGGCVPIYIESQIADGLRAMKSDVERLGEWLMFCWLDLVIACADAVDNSRPDWLRPYAGASRLQIDRSYPTLQLGFEFQGPQHFSAAGIYADNVEEFNKQVNRDAIKMGICSRRGYRLVEIVKDDLTLTGVTAKIPLGTPLNLFRKNGPIVMALTDLSDAYMNYKALA